MNLAVVAPRVAGINSQCHCCMRWRRVGRIWLDNVDDVVVRRFLLLCSGCLRYAWDAAKTVAK